jgi:putative acetyltransferase
MVSGGSSTIDCLSLLDQTPPHDPYENHGGGLNPFARNRDGAGDFAAVCGIPMFAIREDDLRGAATQALLAHHLREMHANSPPGSVFALDLSGLRSPGVCVWTAWRGEKLAGVAALNDLGNGVGELKSMRTAPDHLRQGVAAALLDHIIQVARTRGLRRISLETGSGPAFEPALALYRSRGFENGDAFGTYESSAFNQFLHLSL